MLLPSPPPGGSPSSPTVHLSATRSGKERMSRKSDLAGDDGVDVDEEGDAKDSGGEDAVIKDEPKEIGPTSFPSRKRRRTMRTRLFSRNGIRKQEEDDDKSKFSHCHCRHIEATLVAATLLGRRKGFPPPTAVRQGDKG